MIRKIKNAVLKIQKKEDKEKKKYLVILSSITFIAVLFLWFTYFSYYVIPENPGLKENKLAESLKTKTETSNNKIVENKSGGLFNAEVFSAGVKSVSRSIAKAAEEIYQKTKNALYSLKNMITKTKDIEIKQEKNTVEYIKKYNMPEEGEIKQENEKNF